MKKYKRIILLVIIGILFITKCYAKELPLLGKCIYIDPGHGGKDPGAIYKDIKEKDINLLYAKKIGEYLENNGAIIYTNGKYYALSNTILVPRFHSKQEVEALKAEKTNTNH